MSDPEVVVRLLAAIDERERLIPLEHDGIGQDGSWHTRQCGYRQGEWLEPCECDVPVELRRLCQSHRDIVARHSPFTIHVHDPAKYGHTSPSDFAEEQACARCGTPSEYPVAWPCADLIDLARGYGVEDGT